MYIYLHLHKYTYIGRSQMRRAYGEHIVCLATERVMPYNFELAR
jgi:hypothetical protein